MAVPLPSAPVWQKLAAGGLSRVRTDNLGTQMLAKRIERSAAPVSDKALEIYQYYAKWERGLAHEIAQFA
ncbi:hypothetical protein BH10PSE15_BH10PSE15_08100 [soil metagenome]